MSELNRHNRLGDFVRLLKYHETEIRESMPRPHPINKLKRFGDKNLISTGELCMIFVNSRHELACRFGYGFGMESATFAQFEKMIQRVREAGFLREGDEMRRRIGRSYIDLQFSCHLLNADSGRRPANDWGYRDYAFFRDYQFLIGTARGYEVDWVIIADAIDKLDSSTAR